MDYLTESLFAASSMPPKPTPSFPVGEPPSVHLETREEEEEEGSQENTEMLHQRFSSQSKTATAGVFPVSNVSLGNHFAEKMENEGTVPKMPKVSKEEKEEEKEVRSGGGTMSAEEEEEETRAPSVSSLRALMSGTQIPNLDEWISETDKFEQPVLPSRNKQQYVSSSRKYVYHRHMMPSTDNSCGLHKKAMKQIQKSGPVLKQMAVPVQTLVSSMCALGHKPSQQDCISSRCFSIPYMDKHNLIRNGKLVRDSQAADPLHFWCLTVCDGHGDYGGEVSSFVAENMHKYLVTGINKTLAEQHDSKSSDSNKTTEDEAPKYVAATKSRKKRNQPPAEPSKKKPTVQNKSGIACSQEEPKRDPTMVGLLTRIYRSIQLYLQKPSLEHWGESGTTCVSILVELESGKCWISWVGDSRAVLLTWNKLGHLQSLWETKDHSPECPYERANLERHGKDPPMFDEDGEVWRCGGLTMTRALGDTESTRSIFHDPDVLVCSLYPHGCTYCRTHDLTLKFANGPTSSVDAEETILLMATDGFWNCFPNASTHEFLHELNQSFGCLVEEDEKEHTTYLVEEEEEEEGHSTSNPKPSDRSSVHKPSSSLRLDQTRFSSTDLVKTFCLKHPDGLDNVSAVMVRFRLPSRPQ